ncbi:MAG: hypothetical protein JRH16_19960 [Deltaproteobacteria bacterium]|nr:hypothetical protein [Deltaproteobacteria bacterium]MBW2420054.1 hypothetical protein [Deltaproteobacteria bacterium]
MTWDALEDAGIPPESLQGERVIDGTANSPHSGQEGSAGRAGQQQGRDGSGNPEPRPGCERDHRVFCTEIANFSA